ITLEVNNQLNTKLFQRDTWSSQESAPTFAELFEITNLKAQAQAKGTVILKLKEKLNSLNGDVKDRDVKRNVEDMETLNIELDHKEKVLVITALKEQLDKLKGKAVITEAVSLNPIDPKLLKVDVTPVVPKLRKNRTAHIDYIRHTQGEAATLRKIVKSCPNRPLVVQIVLWYLDSSCSKHMTGDRSQLVNFVQKFLGTVKFGNDHVAKIMGYGEYQIGNVTISRASKTKSWLWHRRLSHLNFGSINHLARQGLVRGLPKLKFEKDHLCSACAMGKSTRKTHKPKSKDTNQEKLYLLHIDLCGPMRVESVRLKVPVRRIRTDNGTKFVNHTLRDYYEEVGISHETSVARSPQENGVVERRNCTLIEAARTMLIYAQAPLFLWAKAVATACFTQNHCIIRLRHGKTPYELLHNKLPDLSYFYVFGALCYPTNDSENLGKLQPKADIGIFIGYALTKKAFRIYNRRTRRIVEIIHVDFDELTTMASKKRSSGPALNEMTPGTISSGCMPTSSPSTSYVPPSRIDRDLLFQPMFDELLNPPPSGVNQAPEAIAPIVEVILPVNADLTGSPSSTMVEQDAPSTSNSTTPTETQCLIIPQDVGDDNLDMEVAHMGSDPLFSIPIPEINSEQYTTPASPQAIVQTDHPLPHNNCKWTMDHPLNNIIGQLDRPVSTRLQLHEQALFCYYDAFLTSVEPKTYKEALTQSC
nr:hypothetical protein [Tanacetum cinerariifolium]